MGVSLYFEPIYGVNTNSRAVASILTIDGYKILLDCGWASSFDTSLITALSSRANTIDAVLLSFPDLPHIGALPYLVGRCGLAAPVISTLPVWRMGQMFLYDAYQSVVAKRSFDTFNLDDVDAAFEVGGQDTRYHHVKYQQRFPLGDTGITVTPHPAGHMLGGAVWHISKGTESIVYATDFNHRRERHLKPISFTTFSRPSHLIVPANRVRATLRNGPNDLPQCVEDVVSRGGNVLIPVDSAGRLVELVVMLYDAWFKSTSLSKVSLVVLNEFAKRINDFTKSMIEWMSDEVVKRFDVSRENLFNFRKDLLRHVHSRSELDQLPNPKVVLASSPSLDYGFARDLFLEWCSSPLNTVILVDLPEAGTLYNELYQRAVNQDNTVTPSRFSLQLKIEAKVQLSGEELRQWREEEKARKLAEEAEAQRLIDEQKALEMENAALDGDGDVNMDEVANGKNSSMDGTGKGEDVPQSPVSSASVSDFDEQMEERIEKAMELAGKFSWTRNPVDKVLGGKDFKQPEWDEYGQVIDTTRFMIGEDPGEGAPEQPNEFAPGGLGFEAVGENQEVIPTKYVEHEQQVVVACSLIVIDCAGLSDGESLKRLVKKMEPRRIVITKGTEEERAELKRFVVESVFSSELVGEERNGTVGGGKDSDVPLQDVVCPGVREVVDITTNTPVQDVWLREALVAQLKWSEVGGCAVAHVDAVLAKDEETGGPALDVMSPITLVEDTEENEMEVEKKEVAFEGHRTVFIGSIMLNRLRDSLEKEGLRAEFAGGVLCIENGDTGAVILVKKIGPQNIVLDGAFSEEYFIVREVLYRELIVPM